MENTNEGAEVFSELSKAIQFAMDNCPDDRHPVIDGTDGKFSVVFERDVPEGIFV